MIEKLREIRKKIAQKYGKFPTDLERLVALPKAKCSSESFGFIYSKSLLGIFNDRIFHSQCKDDHARTEQLEMP